MNFGDKQKVWFVALLEGMVQKPEALQVDRIRGVRDLEIAIIPDPLDLGVFTDEVCYALQTLVGKVTGAFPIIYVKDHPHPRAKASFAQDQYFL